LATPQVEDGHIKIANELAMALAKISLTGYENRILWSIIRRTYGWNKKSDRISYSQFEADTGIDHRHTGRTLKSLKTRGIITCSGEGYNLTYGVQKDYEKWDKFTTIRGTDSPPSEAPITGEKSVPVLAQSVPVLAQLPPSEAPNLPPSEAHTKAIKHITKDNIQKTVPPVWVNRKLWDAFLEVRKKKKAPETETAIHLLILELEKLKNAGDDPNEVLKVSIMRGWTGVFPLKHTPLLPLNGQNGGKSGTSQEHSQTDDYAARRAASIGAPIVRK
jgi:phage replication O-like protein O